MGNRFVRAIRSGEIDSIEALKSEFKRLAKQTHPDLNSASERMDEFIGVRSDYEKALDGFERYRFGASAGVEDRSRRARVCFDRASFYAYLIALFKRGFPKTPRHEKERLRYEYARYLSLGQTRVWSAARSGLFEAFEAAMIKAKAEGGKAYDEILDLLHEIFGYHHNGLSLIREGVRQQHTLFILDRRSDPAIREFLKLLVKDLVYGPAFR